MFEVLLDAVRVCSLGQITTALFEVGGHYRRSMQGRLARRTYDSRPLRSSSGLQRGANYPVAE